MGAEADALSGPLTTMVATCYLLGVSTRRMEKLVETLGIQPWTPQLLATTTPQQLSAASIRGRCGPSTEPAYCSIHSAVRRLKSSRCEGRPSMMNRWLASG
ncbi:MAG: hypothetical protein QOF10_6289 [Kribbellaceae bacterium]|nr:hypothetical protein [Kribbellaceae bacterium]